MQSEISECQGHIFATTSCMTSSTVLSSSMLFTASPTCSSVMGSKAVSHAALRHQNSAHFQIRSQRWLLSSFCVLGFLLTILEASTTKNLHTSVLVKNLKDPNLAQQRHLQFFKTPPHLGGMCIIKRCRKTKHLIILRFSTTSQRGHFNLLKTFRASVAAMRKY